MTTLAAPVSNSDSKTREEKLQAAKKKVRMMSVIIESIPLYLRALLTTVKDVSRKASQGSPTEIRIDQFHLFSRICIHNHASQGLICREIRPSGRTTSSTKITRRSCHQRCGSRCVAARGGHRRSAGRCQQRHQAAFTRYESELDNGCQWLRERRTAPSRRKRNAGGPWARSFSHCQHEHQLQGWYRSHDGLHERLGRF